MLVAVGSAGLGILAYATNAFRSLELNTIDTRFSVRGERDPPDELVVVGVNRDTFADLPNQRWPYTHDLHARVIDELRRDGAKVIVLDIQFSEPSNTDAESIALLDAVDRANNVVASTLDVDDYGNGNVFPYALPVRVERSTKREAWNRWLRRDLDLEIGYGGYPTDPGGVIRRMLHDVNGLESLPVAVAQVATGRPIGTRDFDDGTAWIDYYGPPDKIREISYSDVFRGRTPKGTFRDKIVVVGATIEVLQDVHSTPTSGDSLMSGPEIQATSIGTVLSGFPLQELPGPLDYVLIALMAVAIPAATLRLSIVPALGLALLLGLAYAGATQLAFNGKTLLPVVYPLGALVLSVVGALAVYYLIEAFERERTRDVFSRFVPESVVGEVLKEADGLRLGGVAREATVMFSDLRGFTSFAEALEPDQVIAILNRYLTAMVDDAILPRGGTLVDYMGDGIMAVFGAPIQTDDHAHQALAAARDKLRELAKFNDWLRTEMGFDKSFQMGIGLNSGQVMSGNVGSERRLAYTAIGDTTNTAARLEAMTKGTPYMLFMSDSTRAGLSEEPSDLVYVDDFEVRGREQKVKIWSVAEAERERFGGGEAFRSVAKEPQAPA